MCSTAILIGRHSVASRRGSAGQASAGIGPRARLCADAMTDDPFRLFDAWYAEACVSEPNDPNGMALATCGIDLRPQVRMVLMKDHGPDGFTFYTNVDSAKGQALAANRHAALLFHWKSLRRQVRVEGEVTQVDNATADAYFATRPRDSQLGAWASAQSRPLPQREVFVAGIAAATARFDDNDVPRPPFWTGFRLVPRHIEFWRDQAYRLHERRVFDRDDDGRWRDGLLYP